MAVAKRSGRPEVYALTASFYQTHPAPAQLRRAELDQLVVTSIKQADGTVVAVSLYGDPVWNYSPFMPHAARGKTEKEIVWAKSPSEWVDSLKSAAAAFTFRTPPRGLQLDPGTIPKRFLTLNAFAKWCSSEGVHQFRDVSKFHISRYLQTLRMNGVYDRTLAMHIAVLRRVYDLRDSMEDSFSAQAMEVLQFNQLGSLWEPEANDERKTELIPLADAANLFSAARTHLEAARGLLLLRDKLAADWEKAKHRVSRNTWGEEVKRPAVLEAGFNNALEFETALLDIRTAAYIVLAMTTGCRVHELGDAQVGCVYSEVVDGETYWWLKSSTRKIGNGPARWLAPAVAKEAADILEAYSAPLRNRIAIELSKARERFPKMMPEVERGALAAQILELERNANRLFLSDTPIGVVSTGTNSHNKQLEAFAKRKGVHLSSPLRTHRFRRTYAVIVVHWNKGARIDLLTLQHHYKHATVLMTEWYAGLSDTDRELYDLIEDENDYFDLALIDHWMDTATPIAGGFGKRIRAYAGKHHQPMFFKSKGEFIASIREGLNIRSTGHSWCLVEASDCGGRGLFDAPTCGVCVNGVIDGSFTEVWRNIRVHHEELLQLTDIGPGGLAKAERSLAAANAVLGDLIQTAEPTDG